MLEFFRGYCLSVCLPAQILVVSQGLQVHQGCHIAGYSSSTLLTVLRPEPNPALYLEEMEARD